MGSLIRAGVSQVPVVTVNTPWGEAEFPETLAAGVIEVSTASHGGIGVGGDAINRLSDAAKDRAISWGGRYWFEEDCNWAIVCHEMPELFDECRRRFAVESLERWNRTYLQAFGK